MPPWPSLYSALTTVAIMEHIPTPFFRSSTKPESFTKSRMLALPDVLPATTVLAVDRSSMLAVPAPRNTIFWLPPFSSRVVPVTVMVSLPQATQNPQGRIDIPTGRNRPSGRGLNPATRSLSPQNQVKWYSGR